MRETQVGNLVVANDVYLYILSDRYSLRLIEEDDVFFKPIDWCFSVLPPGTKRLL